MKLNSDRNDSKNKSALNNVSSDQCVMLVESSGMKSSSALINRQYNYTQIYS